MGEEATRSREWSGVQVGPLGFWVRVCREFAPFHGDEGAYAKISHYSNRRCCDDELAYLGGLASRGEGNGRRFAKA